MTIALGAKARPAKAHQNAIDVGQGVARAVSLTRDLVNEPPNELNPARLASEAQRMAKEAGLKCRGSNAKRSKSAG